jgi:hypothetical protein
MKQVHKVYIFTTKKLNFMTKLNILIVLSFFSFFMANAQDSLAIKTKKRWSFLAEPYLMFPNMKGTLGVGNLPNVSLDADPDEIFSHLKMGAMVYLEARNGKWAISSDYLYMKLNQDVTSNNLINSGDVTMKQTAWELAGLYKINGWIEAGAGMRLNSLSADVALKIASLPPGSETSQSKSISETWVDPIIVARFTAPLKGKWLLQMRTDIGGFGVGSDFAWQVQADAGYRFSKLFFATLGYRAIDADFESGSGSDRFKYDITTFGPTVRLGFNF